MKKTNNNSSKVIAVILVIAFLGINYYRTSNEAGPQEQLFAETKEAQAQARKIEEKVSPTYNTEKLKFAYTGKWEKNDLSKPGQHAFTPPTNERNNIVPTSAQTKKKNEKTKKKIAGKKKKSNKVAKKYNKKSRFDWDTDHSPADAGYTVAANTYYTKQQPPQDRTPNEEEKKKLSLEEWIALVKETNSVSELVSKTKSGDVNKSIFYSVVESLLSDTDAYKKLGFGALEAIPSVQSLAKYAEHINDEMSPEVKAYAQNTLKVYNQPSQLRVLNSALSNTSDDVKIIAATLIKDIVTAILQTEASSGENVVYTEAQITQYRLMLTASQAIINNALTTVSGLVLASFNSTLALITQFLG